MAKRIFLALLLFFIFPIQQIEAKQALQATVTNETASVNTTMMLAADETETEVKVPAKEAHENPQKWVNIILVIIFVLAGAGLTAIAIVIRKSKR